MYLVDGDNVSLYPVNKLEINVLRIYSAQTGPLAAKAPRLVAAFESWWY